VSSRIPGPADPFEEEGLASPDPDQDAKRITGDPQEEIPVPAERPVASTDYGTTADEERRDEPLEQQLAREQPDQRAGATADESPEADQPYPEDAEEKVGRIVAPDEGARGDDEASAVANDIGTDKGGFSAEERAMHIAPDPET
jgi:hypothetical protein